MTDNFDFLIGTIVGFHGLAGEVKVRSSTNNPDILLGLTKVRIEPAPAMTAFKPAEKLLPISSLRLDRKLLLLTFEGYNDRNAVEHLEGATLYAPSADILPLQAEEFWVKDLVGMQVFTTGGARVGKVISIIYSGNDLLEIQREEDPPGKTVLVPFVQNLVPVVDLKNRRLEVIDLPGLLEPQ